MSDLDEGTARRWSTTAPGAMTAARTALSALAEVVAPAVPGDTGGHHRAAAQAAGALRELRSRAVGVDVTLHVTDGGLWLGGTPLVRESIALADLVVALERGHVASLRLTADPTDGDVEAFASALRQGLPASAGGAIAVERSAEPGSPGSGGLRRAYGSALALLRRVAAAAAPRMGGAGAERAVDLAAATAVVEALDDAVAADPAGALLLTTLESRDEYALYHMVNVAVLSLVLGRALGLRDDQVRVLGLGGLLHDVGKVALPLDALEHAGGLTEEQWRLVQRHPVDGAGMVLRTGEGLVHPAAAIVLEHHAAYDLTGYPALTGRAGPSLPARLVAVADCFDAVTSRRAYRDATERRRALAVLEAGAGAGFDPRAVRAFLRMLGVFPVGSLVRLDSGEVCLVVAASQEEPARPHVRVVLDAAGDPADGEERSLATRDDRGAHRWSVAETVDPDELRIDVLEVAVAGRLTAPEPATGGLVHEPSPGEAPPPGYVEAHGHSATAPGMSRADAGWRVDPDVAPPL